MGWVRAQQENKKGKKRPPGAGAGGMGQGDLGWRVGPVVPGRASFTAWERGRRPTADLPGGPEPSSGRGKRRREGSAGGAGVLNGAGASGRTNDPARPGPQRSGRREWDPRLEAARLSGSAGGRAKPPASQVALLT